jgi:MoaA/NifB/PqqE/SkfB family radical SAM enzyme
MKHKHYRPIVCVWELTLACNMRCLHCGSYAGKVREGELTTAQALRVADELAQIGVQRLTLSGGELLLRDDWHIIASRLISQGVRVGLISNGFLMLRHIDRIAALGPLEVVALSVDGLKNTHDSFRRTEGSFDRIAEAYRELNKIGVRTAAVTAVSMLNIGELDELHDALAGFGVKAWQLQMLFGGGRMREHPDFIPGPSEIERIARFIIRKKKAGGPVNVFCADGIGYGTELDEPMRGAPWKGCQAGLWGIGIEANGNVKGCLSLYPEAHENNPFVEGNLLSESLREIWEKPGAFAYNRQFDYRRVKGYCRHCPHVECRCGCTAVSYFATGTTYENPYCMLRAREDAKKH